MRIYTLQQTIKLNPRMYKSFFCNVIGLVALSLSLYIVCGPQLDYITSAYGSV